MTCDHCKKDKPDVMPRWAAMGQERLDGKYCASCCATVLGRKWMAHYIDEDVKVSV